jgi:Ca-activated chloride channel family protein
MTKHFDIDDPRLTAYVLGELSDEDRAEIDAQIEANEDLREVVAEIRAVTELLETELGAEPVATFTKDQRESVLAQSANGTSQRRFPRLFSRVAAVAAMLALVAGASYVWYSVVKTPSAPLPMLAKAEKAAEVPETALSAGFKIKDLNENGRMEVARSDVSRVNLGVSKPLFISTPQSLKSLSIPEEIRTAEVLALSQKGASKARPVQMGDFAAVLSGTEGDLKARPDTDVFYDWELAGSGMEAGIVSKPLGTQETSPDGFREYSVSEPSAWTDTFERIESRERGREADGVETVYARGDSHEWDFETEARPRESRVSGERSGTETYEFIVDNPFRRVSDAPLSTFSVDVDTASYANVRRFLNDGQLPPKPAVRVEELVNYFTYDYPRAKGGEPFSVTTDVATCPWNEGHKLARIGLRGKEIDFDDRQPANLVFLLDVSGSMKDDNKLPLLKNAMSTLVKHLPKIDRVAIVSYADEAKVVIDSTPVSKGQTILKHIECLCAGGSTNGAAGIEKAYEIASDNFVEGGVNRVILATDGDFNVDVSDRSGLVDLITDNAKSGVFLTVLGFGTGNLKDANLEGLADSGNGHYAYIDSFNEARRVLIEQVGGTFFTIAKDVKVQVEFNPGKVSAYRLIGYENRTMADRDFTDDRKDAGEIGAGHTVTALYELVPPGVGGTMPGIDPLKYQKPAETPENVVKSDELMTVNLRYKEPDGDKSTEVGVPVPDRSIDGDETSADYMFAAAVAGFGMLLRDSDYAGNATFDLVLDLARAGKGKDDDGRRAEFVNLVETAQALKAR